MFAHGPNCLKGPVTQAREWWQADTGEGWQAHPNSPQQREASIMDIGQRDLRPSDAPIRTELVERVRREIAQGTYDTPEKWAAALDRLLRRLEAD